jgi:HSP20 family protein
MNPLIRQDPLDDIFRGFFVRPIGYGLAGEAPNIKIEVREQERSFLAHAEMPGIKKEDIHVSIDGSVVSITAERKQERDVKEGERVVLMERYFGKVSRSFQLGQDIDDSKASAKFSDGVLELTLPKKEATQSRRLNID